MINLKFDEEKNLLYCMIGHLKFYFPNSFSVEKALEYIKNLEEKTKLLEARG